MPTDPSDLSPAIEAAWGLRERPTKGPKPALSVDRILDAAIELAVTEGIDAVSMARVGKALGSAPMSLYRHVASKDELVMLMLDRAFGIPAPPPADADWRAGLTHWCWVYRDALMRHPWSLQVPISGPPILPNQVRWFEDGLAAMTNTTLSEAQKLSTVLLLSGFVRNEAGLTLGLMAARPAGDQIMPTWSEHLRRLTAAGDFPALAAALASGALDQDDDPSEEFTFGLERILDGVQQLIIP